MTVDHALQTTAVIKSVVSKFSYKATHETNEDLCQEVFVKLLTTTAPKKRRATATWVREVGKNMSIDAVRHHTAFKRDIRKLVFESDLVHPLDTVISDFEDLRIPQYGDDELYSASLHQLGLDGVEIDLQHTDQERFVSDKEEISNIKLVLRRAYKKMSDRDRKLLGELLDPSDLSDVEIACIFSEGAKVRQTYFVIGYKLGLTENQVSSTIQKIRKIFKEVIMSDSRFSSMQDRLGSIR